MRRHNFLTILLLLLSMASLAISAWRVSQNFYQTPIDFLIFLKAGKDFQEHGRLYQRAENIQEKYHPSAAIFKFPPAFQLALIPLLDVPKHVDLLLIMKLSFIGLYALSLGFLFVYLKNHFSLSQKAQLYFGCLLTIISCWTMSFYECLRWLLTEIPLLFIFVSSFVLLQHKRYRPMLSGALLAYAACIKIYPAFLLGYLAIQRHSWAVLGAVIGTIIVSFLSLWIFGIQEHIFYATKLLPVLLDEPVISKWINLNLEKFLYGFGVIDDITGYWFQAFRLLFLSGLLWIGLKNQRYWLQEPLSGFSMFVTTMFFCFPNYWPQYQIFLLIPITYLLASYFKKQSTCSIIMLIIAITPLFIADSFAESVLRWEMLAKSVDSNLLLESFSREGILAFITHQLFMSMASYHLFDLRALVPVFIWILLYKEILSSKRQGF